MSSLRVNKIVRYCAIFAQIVTFAACAEGAVKVKAIAGPYGAYSVEGVWVQRIVTLANEGDQPKRMKFGCLADDTEQGKTHYTCVVDVPPGWERKAVLAHRPGKLVSSQASATPSRTKPVRCEQLYLLWDTDANVQIPQPAQQTTKLPEGLTRFAATTGQKILGDSYRYLSELPGNQLGPVQLMNEKPFDLPDRWYGYSMVDMLAFGAVDLSAMRPSQVSAMLNWVQRGGCVILTGSNRLHEILRSPIGLSAGVCAVGLHDTAELNVTGPGLSGVKSELDMAMPMVEIETHQAKTIYRANGLPLLTAKTFGNGHVLTLAVPLGALSDPQLHKIWATVREIGQSLAPLDAERFLPNGKIALRQIAGKRGASAQTPISILAGLTVIVLVVGIVLRLRRRGEILWAVLVPLALLISVSLYAYGLTLGNPERLSNIGLISTLDDGQARVQQTFAYYSGPNDNTIDLSTGSPRGVVLAVGGGAAGVTGEVRTRAGCELPDQAIAKNNTAAFYVDSVEPLRAVKTALSFGPDGPAGTIENLLPTPINDAVLYTNRRSYRLGTLPPGKMDVKISPANALAEGEFTGGAAIDPLRNELVKSLVSAQKNNARRTSGRRVKISGKPMLIGYTTFLPLTPLGERPLQHQGWSVLTCPIQMTCPPSGTDITIPAGMTTTEQAGSLRDARTGGFQETQYGGTLELRIAPPEAIPPLENPTVELAINVNATNFGMTVSGGKLDANGVIVPKETLASYASPSGLFRIDVPQADRFADSEGKLLFHIRIKRAGTGGDTNLMAKTSKARIESIQVSLKGTVR